MEISGYTIKRIIGKGGMGTVYLATQESLGRDIVLKTLTIGDSESTEFQDRFMNEARIVAALRHPHIITIYDIGASDEVLYIAMEYIDGGDLKGRLNGPLPPHACLELLMKIGAALEIAHMEGTVHRDVKPANILFRNDGTPLLSDFGIAKQIKLDSELTSTGTILGSPFYMSPEQSEGKLVDGRTDIYSLGVIFYEILTGRRPYEGDSAIKIIMQHLQSPLPKLPRELIRFQPLLDGMMAKDREKRISDAGTLVSTVRRLAEKEEGSPANVSSIALTRASARPEPPPMPPTRTLRPWLIGLGGVGMFTLGIVTFWLYAQTLQSSQIVLAPPLASTVGALPALPPPPDPSKAAGSSNGAPNNSPPVGEVVRALEWLAQNSLRDGRLTSPPADNAYYFYSRLLAIDPANTSARAGFEKIAEQYVVLAEQAFTRRDYRQARTFIALGRQIAPANKGLSALETFINSQEQSFWDQLLSAIRS
jgi:serine/threonine protein kinase